MALFYAVSSSGLRDVLHEEMEGLGLQNITPDGSGVYFDGTWKDCYLANLCLRTTSRILLKLASFPAYKEEELYNNALKIPFFKYIRPDMTMRVDASCRDCTVKDSMYLGLKLKDAIADSIREKTGERPSVSKSDPDVFFVIKGYRNQFDVYIDTSGIPLFKRGYRVGSTEAHLKETLAAALLMKTEWFSEKKLTMMDPFCGSGTLLIEAALMYKKIMPGTLRKGFCFQNLPSFNSDSFDTTITNLLDDELELPDEPEIMFYGHDKDEKALDVARKNAEEAGVADVIDFSRRNVRDIEAPCEKGIIVTNPPYGVRLGDEFFLEETYKNFSYALKQNFKGWSAWVLSGNPDMAKHFKLKSKEKHRVFNGPLECRFLNYEIRRE